MRFSPCFSNGAEVKYLLHAWRLVIRERYVLDTIWKLGVGIEIFVTEVENFIPLAVVLV